jgi:DNA replication protein DnaC
MTAAVTPTAPTPSVKKAHEGKVDLDQTRERLLRLGLLRAAEHLDQQLTEASKLSLSPHKVLDQILDEELLCREERRVRTSLRLSSLPSGQTLGNFDFAFQPALERSRIETLATCQWIKENRTLLIQGPPGVGKTHLAIALGMRAVELGFGVVFYRLEDLLAALKRDADLPTSKLRSKKYLATSLVIIDEVGFEPMTRHEASLFFRLVSHRYQRGSILITTNKGIRDWPEVLAGDEILATAILDRLLHNSHVLDIKGRSYRLRDLERAAIGRA